MNSISKFVATAAVAVGASSAAGSAQALDLDPDPGVGAYYSVRFGNSRTESKPVQHFGVRLTDPGIGFGVVPDAASVPLDLRFSPRGFDGLYARGVDLAPRIRALAAAEGGAAAEGEDGTIGIVIAVGAALGIAVYALANSSEPDFRGVKFFGGK